MPVVSGVVVYISFSATAVPTPSVVVMGVVLTSCEWPGSVTVAVPVIHKVRLKM